MQFYKYRVIWYVAFVITIILCVIFCDFGVLKLGAMNHEYICCNKFINYN
jgi:hypothetical protein